MEVVLAWIVPVFCMSWLLLQFRPSRRGNAISTVALVVVVWAMCMWRVEWTSEVSILLWWIISAIAGILVCYSLWPRTSSE